MSKRQKYSGGTCKSISDRGSALMEFAITFPLCIFFFFGVLAFGRLLVQAIWVQQTGYNAAYMGADVSETVVAEFMNNIVDTLSGFQNKNVKNQVDIEAYNPGTDSVEVTFKADLKMITSFSPLSISVRTVGPNVLVDNVAPGNPNLFENPCNGGADLCLNPITCCS